MFLTYSYLDGTKMININSITEVTFYWDKNICKYRLTISIENLPTPILLIEDKDKQTVNYAYCRINAGINAQRPIIDITDITDKWLENKED